MSSTTTAAQGSLRSSAVIVAKHVVEHMVLQSAGSIVHVPTQRNSTHSSCAPVHVDEQRDGNIAFAMLFSSLLTVITKDGPVESSKGRYGRVTNFRKKELATEERGINDLGKEVRRNL